MSWSPRDHRILSGEHEGFTPKPLPEEMHDEEALPSYAVGLEDYVEDQWPLHVEQRLQRETGFLSREQLDRLGWMMRRGYTER